MSITHVFRSLNQEMLAREFLSKNPLFLHVSQTGSTQALAQAIRQYVRLPEEIVTYLKTAAAWFPSEHPIHRELERNWNQEQGSATGGVPHVAILKQRLKHDLQLDASGVVSNASTHRFLKTLEVGMKRGRWFAVGRVYALEATAVPELAQLVGPALNLYARLTGQAEPIQPWALRTHEVNPRIPAITTAEQARTLSMSDWFALHVLDFEIGHRDLLQEAVKGELREMADIAEFTAGFRAVLDAMDEWWRGIHASS